MRLLGQDLNAGILVDGHRARGDEKLLQDGAVRIKGMQKMSFYPSDLANETFDSYRLVRKVRYVNIKKGSHRRKLANYEIISYKTKRVRRKNR